MIGLSICFCVYEMARGNVDLNVVTKLYTSSPNSSHEYWENMITQYRKTFWSQYAERAENIFRSFLAEGRIVAPRITEHWMPNIGSTGIWVESEEQIVKLLCAD